VDAATGICTGAEVKMAPGAMRATVSWLDRVMTLAPVVCLKSVVDRTLSSPSSRIEATSSEGTRPAFLAVRKGPRS